MDVSTKAPTAYALSGSCGNYNITTAVANNYSDVTNLTTSFSCTGRPVMIYLVHDNGASTTEFYYTSGAWNLVVVRDSTIISEQAIIFNPALGEGYINSNPILDPAPSIGSHTYKIQVRHLGTSNDGVAIRYFKLLVTEL